VFVHSIALAARVCLPVFAPYSAPFTWLVVR
jgi:hypothetical protein